MNEPEVCLEDSRTGGRAYVTERSLRLAGYERVREADTSNEDKWVGDGGPTCLYMLQGALARVPSRAYQTDTGYDLALSQDVMIPANSFADVSTGVYIQGPVGHWSRITGRSSSLRNHGVLVNEGIIDEGYQGELFVGCWNLRGIPVNLPKGTRIAQLIFHQRIDVEWKRAETFASSERGATGFGSTGQ